EANDEAGEEAEICAVLLSGGDPVLNANIVEARLEGPGQLRNDSVGTITGEPVCGLFYQAPRPLPEEPTVATVIVAVEDTPTSERTEERLEIPLGPSNLQLTVDPVSRI